MQVGAIEGDGWAVPVNQLNQDWSLRELPSLPIEPLLQARRLSIMHRTDVQWAKCKNMSQAIPTELDGALLGEIHSLVSLHRDCCLWFTDEDYLPTHPTQALRVLKRIEQHGDREAFIKARRLRTWLLQNSSAISAD